MTGRGIDQILPHPGNPKLYEGYVKNAIDYVNLAEAANGPISKPVDFSYIWGEALEEFKRYAPDFKLINLETSITQSNDYNPHKEVLYRMNPENAACLTSAQIDCCSLANNHILDWGEDGLKETLATLKTEGIQFAGAGLTEKEAKSPAIVDIPGKGRAIIFSLGSSSSGVPPNWAAKNNQPGVYYADESSQENVQEIKEEVKKLKQPGDIVIVSIHWGSNWDFDIPEKQRKFAHQLIDEAGVDLIHGHSSHHVKGIEVYSEKLILYGCGDFITDYEGISGFETYRGELGLMYFAKISPETGDLIELEMIPVTVNKMQVIKASKEEAGHLYKILSREGKKLGTRFELKNNNTLQLL